MIVRLVFGFGQDLDGLKRERERERERTIEGEQWIPVSFMLLGQSVWFPSGFKSQTHHSTYSH